VYVSYEGLGVAEIFRERTGPATNTYAVRLAGSELASGLSSLSLAELDTLMNFTAEPATVAETLADHESRLDVLELE
jgi:hypothetical protein